MNGSSQEASFEVEPEGRERNAEEWLEVRVRWDRATAEGS